MSEVSRVAWLEAATDDSTVTFGLADDRTAYTLPEGAARSLAATLLTVSLTSGAAIRLKVDEGGATVRSVRLIGRPHLSDDDVQHLARRQRTGRATPTR